MLNAKAIEYLRQRWTPDGGLLVHFYFHFQGQNDVNYMLRSFLMQLMDSPNETFPQIEQLFESNRGNGARQPSRRELLETLRLALTAKSKVFVVLDALDECNSVEGEHLGEALAQMHEWNLEGAHFLITSRQGGLANSALRNLVSSQNQMPVRQKEVDVDIRVWVEHELSMSRTLGQKLSGWDEPDSLKARIQERLLQNASGMYVTLIILLFRALK